MMIKGLLAITKSLKKKLRKELSSFYKKILKLSLIWFLQMAVWWIKRLSSKLNKLSKPDYWTEVAEKNMMDIVLELEGDRWGHALQILNAFFRKEDSKIVFKNHREVWTTITRTITFSQGTKNT